MSTIGDAGDDFARLAHFQTVLEQHVAKLTALSVKLPTEVARQNAVEHAIQASEKAVTKVKEQKAKAENKPSTPPRPGAGDRRTSRSQPDGPSRPTGPDAPLRHLTAGRIAPGLGYPSRDPCTEDAWSTPPSRPSPLRLPSPRRPTA